MSKRSKRIQAKQNIRKVSFHGDGCFTDRHTDTSYYKKCHVGPIQLSVGDFVFINNGDKPDEISHAYIGQILEMYHTKNSDDGLDCERANVKWYWRKSELSHRLPSKLRKLLTDDQEVYLNSNAKFDSEVELSSVLDVCQILEFSMYDKQPCIANKDENGRGLFYVRQACDGCKKFESLNFPPGGNVPAVQQKGHRTPLAPKGNTLNACYSSEYDQKIKKTPSQNKSKRSGTPLINGQARSVTRSSEKGVTPTKTQSEAYTPKAKKQLALKSPVRASYRTEHAIEMIMIGNAENETSTNSYHPAGNCKRTSKRKASSPLESNCKRTRCAFSPESNITLENNIDIDTRSVSLPCTPKSSRKSSGSMKSNPAPRRRSAVTDTLATPTRPSRKSTSGQTVTSPQKRASEYTPKSRAEKSRTPKKKKVPTATLR